jgi:hypothetical protein
MWYEHKFASKPKAIQSRKRKMKKKTIKEEVTEVIGPIKVWHVRRGDGSQAAFVSEERCYEYASSPNYLPPVITVLEPVEETEKAIKELQKECADLRKKLSVAKKAEEELNELRQFRSFVEGAIRLCPPRLNAEHVGEVNSTDEGD